MVIFIALSTNMTKSLMIVLADSADNGNPLERFKFRGYINHHHYHVSSSDSLQRS